MTLSRQQPTIPKRNPGESHYDYEKRIDAWKRQEVRSKGDLKDFNTATFHLDDTRRVPKW